jgi:hypothetical protein
MTTAVVENEAGPSTTTTAGERAEVFKRLHPEEYISRFLAEGYRPDGRKLNGWRDVSVNIGIYCLLDANAGADEYRLSINSRWISIDQNGRDDDGMWDQGGNCRTRFSKT